MNKKIVKIRGVAKEAVWVEKQGEWPAHWEVDGIEWDGHNILWSFSYEPETYLKQSGLSGDEWRKGGKIRYFKDGIQVYEDFCRDPHYASIKVLETLPKLMNVDWEKIKEGQKIYYDNTPAKIGYIMMDQGTFIVEVDGADRFPRPAYLMNDEDDDDDYEDPKRVKIDVLSHGIWWYRK